MMWPKEKLKLFKIKTFCNFITHKYSFPYPKQLYIKCESLKFKQKS